MPPYSGNSYHERVFNMELPIGMKAIINCIDLDHLGEEWLGRESDRACIEETKTPFSLSRMDTKGECIQDLGFNLPTDNRLHQTQL
jgi:diphthamide synthase (EF-2-diphthine--ammonia ligase)